MELLYADSLVLMAGVDKIHNKIHRQKGQKLTWKIAYDEFSITHYAGVGGNDKIAAIHWVIYLMDTENH